MPGRLDLPISIYIEVLRALRSLLRTGLLLIKQNVRKIARLGLNSIIDVLSTEKEKAIHSVGGFSGLGGLIYALSIFNRFIPDKRIRPTLATLLTWADSFIEKITLWILLAVVPVLSPQ